MPLFLRYAATTDMHLVNTHGDENRPKEEHCVLMLTYCYKSQISCGLGKLPNGSKFSEDQQTSHFDPTWGELSLG